MDVKLALEARTDTYQCLGPREWFAFADEPTRICIRVPGGYMPWESGGQFVQPGVGTVSVAERPVIRLELAGTDGQTLLLQRAE
jgi:hypothetical protein